MKPGILLLGATGGTGRHLLSGALAQAYDVTVLVRDPTKLTVEHARLRVVVGSATDPAAVDDALDGRDAALCVLGTRSPRSLLGCRLMRDSVGVLISAMERRGAQRLVLLSALGVGASATRAPAALRLTFRTMLRQVGTDKAVSEARVRGSGLDWTVVYPTSLTDGPFTGSYRVGDALDLRGLPRISRADVAHFMLAQLTDRTYSRRNAIVGP